MIISGINTLLLQWNTDPRAIACICYMPLPSREISFSVSFLQSLYQKTIFKPLQQNRVHNVSSNEVLIPNLKYDHIGLKYILSIIFFNPRCAFSISWHQRRSYHIRVSSSQQYLVKLGHFYFQPNWKDITKHKAWNEVKIYSQKNLLKVTLNCD